MPSCTTPMFSKMPVTSQLTQRDIVGDLPGERQRRRDGAALDLAVRHSSDADAPPVPATSSAFSTARMRAMKRGDQPHVPAASRRV